MSPNSLITPSSLSLFTSRDIYIARSLPLPFSLPGLHLPFATSIYFLAMMTSVTRFILSIGFVLAMAPGMPAACPMGKSATMGTCTSLNQRKAWSALNDEEKKSYIDAE